MQVMKPIDQIVPVSTEAEESVVIQSENSLIRQKIRLYRITRKELEAREK